VASTFFPQPYKDDVFTLYAYVRTADDLVDSKPVSPKKFLAFEKETYRALATGTSDNLIIQNFVLLAKKHSFSSDDITSFLEAMKQDIKPKPFQTFKDVDTYIYGSAEVIGLFMARIFHLPKKLDAQAKLLGRAMQYINWLRDINEDNQLKRQYLPTQALQKHFLKNLHLAEVTSKPAFFKNFMREELIRYLHWQTKASKAFAHMPRCMRIPVMTASDAYAWTAKQIAKDPFLVYRKKIKPSTALLLWFVLKNWVKSWTSKRCSKKKKNTY
jgi:phytoene synthase